MDYARSALPASRVPVAAFAFGQHVLETYASETNKVAAVWAALRDADLAYRPHPRSMTVADVLRHQLLSERRFFAEFLGCPEPAAATLVPDPLAVGACCDRLVARAEAAVQ